MSSHVPSTHHRDGQDFQEEVARLKFLLERQKENAIDQSKRIHELMSEVDSLKYDNMRLRKLNAGLLAAKRASSSPEDQSLKSQVDSLSQTRTAALTQPEQGGEEKGSGNPGVSALVKSSGDLNPSTFAPKPKGSERLDGPPPFPHHLFESIYGGDYELGPGGIIGDKANLQLGNVSIQQTGASLPVGSGKKQDTACGSSISGYKLPAFPQQAKGSPLQWGEDPWSAQSRASIAAAPHTTPAVGWSAPVTNPFIEAKKKARLQYQTDASHSGEPSSDSDQTDYPAKKRRRN